MALGDKALNEIDKVARSLPGAVNSVSGLIVNLIKTRTRQGTNSAGGSMGQYHPRYANMAKGGQRSPVTLTDTGEMLDSIGVINNDFTNDRAVDVEFDPSLRGAGLRDRSSGRTAARGDVRLSIGPSGQRNQRLARWHSRGHYGKAGGPIARPFMGLTEAEVDQIEVQLSNRIYQTKNTTEGINISLLA